MINSAKKDTLWVFASELDTTAFNSPQEYQPCHLHALAVWPSVHALSHPNFCIQKEPNGWLKVMGEAHFRSCDASVQQKCNSAKQMPAPTLILAASPA